MIIYIVDINDLHTPLFCKEVDYTPAPRIGEKLIADGVMYQVLEVYHNLDVQEIKVVTKKVS